MRRKWTMLAFGLTPLAAGCNVFYYAARNITNEPVLIYEQVALTHQLRSEARDAWAEVRRQFPRKAFTHEFKDGFIDAYSDYLNNGGTAVPPAVPPRKYTRNRYMGAEGQALVHDYFLGWKYGVEVAIATGHRPQLTVPVLLPNTSGGPQPINLQRSLVPPGAPGAQEALPVPRPAGESAPMPMVKPIPIPIPNPEGKPLPKAGAEKPVDPLPGFVLPKVGDKPSDLPAVPIPLPAPGTPLPPIPGVPGVPAPKPGSGSSQDLPPAGAPAVPVASEPFDSGVRQAGFVTPLPPPPLQDLPPGAPIPDLDDKPAAVPFSHESPQPVPMDTNTPSPRRK